MKLLGKLPSKVVASSPAKIIIFGEHAVVPPYSKLGIAASLSDLRSCVSSSFIEEPHEDYNLVITTNSNLHENEQNIIFNIENLLVNTNTKEELEKYVDDLILESENNFEGTSGKILQLISKGYIYNLFLISEFSGIDVLNNYTNKNGLYIDISSEIPLGSGLGSSASLAVSFSASILGLLNHLPHLSSSSTSSSSHQKKKNNEEEIYKNYIESEIELIDSFAYDMECIFHGNPSGLDNFVCSRGGFVSLQEGEKEKLNFFGNNNNFIQDLDFLIVNTNVPRSTSEIVSNVRKRWESSKNEVSNIFSEIEYCSQQFIQSFVVGNNISNSYSYSYDREDFEKQFISLIQKNQSLLYEIGTEVVGHEKFDQIFEVCEDHGFNGCKITGAGAGGCAFVFCEKDKLVDDLPLLRNELENLGFQCFQSNDIGGEGVRIEEIM